MLTQATPTGGGDGFSIHPISDSVMQRMKGKSFPKNCTVKRSDLRYISLRHIDFDGRDREGELVCHKDIASDLVAIFRELHRARYAIERIELIDNFGADDHRSMAANNTSAFCFRRVAGSQKLSNHARGRAIDVNPLYNPMVSANGTRVSPPEGSAYADRSRKFEHKITENDLCYKLFRKHGFTWGGSWKSKKDYQHFEKP